MHFNSCIHKLKYIIEYPLQIFRSFSQLFQVTSNVNKRHLPDMPLCREAFLKAATFVYTPLPILKDRHI